MRLATWLAVLVVCAAILTTVMAYKRTTSKSQPKPVHIVLIGASIGQAWNLAEWPSRADAPGFTAESIAVWQFDKSEAVDEVLIRPARRFRLSRTYFKSLFQPAPRKPDIVILKECSSYFPGDLPMYQASIQRWVRQLQARNIQIMLATVVPVTMGRNARDPGKQESLLAYNHWLRGFAREQHIPLLDLEAAVRSGAEDSYLRDDFTSGDGTHLNASAYAVLDQSLRTALCGVRQLVSCNAGAQGAHALSANPQANR
jgi:hypothetical protein